MQPKPYLRCAVYTRKSSEEGLEQDFNSLHAQREACESFILSQKHEGWHLIKTEYDDGGISGGTMERPALQRLLADIRNRLVDTIVVYKVDRLTRSLADFARMVELFDAQGVSFVSVTQQFNTTSSMGRLTLNVLLSFAQFEREVTGERIRDKIKASKQKGIWMGGNVPLGYDVKERKLLINEAEAKIVLHIFSRYLELGSVLLLKAELDRDKIYTKQRVSDVRPGGKSFSRGGLYAVLANPIYIGRLKHKGQVHDGQQEAVISLDIWDKVQNMLRDHGHTRGRKPMHVTPSLLIGKLFDENGEPLSTNHANKQGKRYRYYISKRLKESTQGMPKHGWRIPAPELENAVAGIAQKALSDRSKLAEALNAAAVASHLIPIALQEASDIALQMPIESRREKLFFEWVQRVDISPQGIMVTLSLASIAPTDPSMHPLTITHAMPLEIKRRGVEMRLVMEPHNALAPRIDATLVKTVARAHCWFNDLATGRVKSITEIAQREGVGKSYVGDIIKLAFLPPTLVEQIVVGKQSATLVTNHLLGVNRQSRNYFVGLEFSYAKRSSKK